MVQGSDDLGARVRASLAYARMDADDAVEVLGFSKRTLDRVYNNQRDLRIPEAKRLAEATGVPLWFLLEGWAGSPGAQISLEEAARQLGPRLLLAAQALRTEEEQEPRGADGQDRRPPSAANPA